MTYLPEPKVSSATRWSYADCPGIGTEDLMRSPYGPARGLVRMPWRVSARCPKPVAKDGIGTMAPRSIAAANAKALYALRCELGQRAYGELTGRKTKVRQPKAPKAPAESRKLIGDLSASDLAEALRAAERSSAGIVVLGQMD